MHETWFDKLKNRPTLQKALAALVASVVAVVGILLFGGDEERDRRVVDSLCAAGLTAIAESGGLDLCTHGPDPRIEALAEPVASTDVLTPVRARSLCPGDGVTGSRVHVFIEPEADRSAAFATLGYAQRYLNLSSDTHRQRIRFLCENGKPTLTELEFPWQATGHFTTMWRTLEANGHDRIDRLYVVLAKPPEYRYCGQGTIGIAGYHESGETPDWRVQPEPQFALVRCQGPSATTLHEIGHTIGVVAPEAPHSSQAWHCWDDADLMCYNDGGPYFDAGGQMQQFCPTERMTSREGTALIRGVFDCQHDDYWRPDMSPGLPYNAAASKFLTKPKLIQ